MVCGHSICFRYVSGQIGTVELSEKALISRSKSKTSEQSGVDWNNGNKDRKRCDIITRRQYKHEALVYIVFYHQGKFISCGSKSWQVWGEHHEAQRQVEFQE
jgi:hypothetical protein